jgi:hypothetical protein
VTVYRGLLWAAGGANERSVHIHRPAQDCARELPALDALNREIHRPAHSLPNSRFGIGLPHTLCVAAVNHIYDSYFRNCALALPDKYPEPDVASFNMRFNVSTTH